MRKYYWNKKELLREFNMLKELLNNNSVSDDEKKKIMDKLADIILLQTMFLFIMNEDEKVSKRCIKNFEFFNDDTLFGFDSASKDNITQVLNGIIETFKRYIRISEDKVRNNITQVQKDMIETHLDLFYNYYPITYINNNSWVLKKFLPEDLKIFFGKEVFLNTNGKEEDFEKMTECKNHFLCLDRHIKGGYCFTFENKAFILSNGKNNIESFITLSHELGHYLEFCFGDSYNNKSMLYDEVASIFLEHITLDVLRKHRIINAREKTNIQKTIMESYTIPYLVSRINNVSPNNAIKNLLSIKNLLYYYYSYIMAVNLYYQYLEDPNMANKNLRKLLINYSDENELDLLRECEIDINGNVLKKHLDKLKNSN